MGPRRLLEAEGTVDGATGRPETPESAVKATAILTIGTELTRGELVNTNGSWLGEQLTGLGYDVVEHLVVPDDSKRIQQSVKRLAGEASVLVATGGLGPTSDDRTGEAAAAAGGVPLVRDQATLERIRQRFAEHGREMPSSNAKQADVPEGARLIPNAWGTAPGFEMELDACCCFFLPGVPDEMKRLFLDAVAPRIAQTERLSHQVHLRSFGHTESEVGQRLDGIEQAHPGVTLGYRAHFPEIEVKVLARAEGAAQAEDLSRRVAEEVRSRLGDAVYGDHGDTFPGAVGRSLRDRGATLAVAESCTGGLVGSMLTSVPGSSEFLLLDAVVYSNSAKTSILGVREEDLRAHGAVSAEVAVAMAEGALRVSGADLSVSVTGIAGPSGGTDAKPVGTVWFAVAQRGQSTTSVHHRLSGDRERIRTLAAYLALRMVRRASEGPVSPT